MNDIMYYDNFAEEYVKNMDMFNPPERYLPTYKNTDNVIKEVWECDNGKLLTLAYTRDEFKDTKYHNYMVTEHVNEMGVSLKRLLRFYLPPKLFDEYWSEIE